MLYQHVSGVTSLCDKSVSDAGFCISSIAERQGMKRGWFTYTDLCVLLEQSAWSQALTAIYQHFTKVRPALCDCKVLTNDCVGSRFTLVRQLQRVCYFVVEKTH